MDPTRGRFNPMNFDSGFTQDSIRALGHIEQELCNGLQSASSALQELAKDKPSLKQVELNTNAFMKSLQSVEANLCQHLVGINQISTGQTHEGSVYSVKKVNNMAFHRLSHVTSELNKIKISPN
ncbi:mediator of RNA polymerase II transcription subunit 11-like [Panonychus citri]|uniref:mediator of RNA polymerase II transcription subunit 11-like n=1 Tax=Panonychus citri TaxID=50023 RepID=UPI002307E143|nr:mediator of RNA polymerase II transcription subunit 11-like [Panonychus citri]